MRHKCKSAADLLENYEIISIEEIKYQKNYKEDSEEIKKKEGLNNCIYIKNMHCNEEIFVCTLEGD